MCGIAGFYERRRSSSRRPALNLMGASIEHRGPDGTRAWRGCEQAGLINARLAVIDLESGAQPMTSRCGRYTLVLNGEIYNYKELRQELRATGAQFGTNSDTEVLLEAYRQWGPASLDRLHGMYAFAVYDASANRLFLARDPTGIKPLYYALVGDWLLFGSEPKALFASGILKARLNPSGIANYLVLGYLPPPSNAFAGVSELAGGSYAVAEGEGFFIKKFWHWERCEQSWPFAEAVDRAEAALVDSLREHLVADVQVGSLLSGGIDSSVIAALLVKRLGVEPDTFTVRFDESAYNEADAARLTAASLKTRHHEVRVTSDEAGSVALANTVLDHFDQPFADSSAIPTYLLCNKVRSHVKVVLAGDGGDEIFGGYTRFFHADIAHSLGRLPAVALSTALTITHHARRLFPDFMRGARKILRAAAEQDASRLEMLSCYNAVSLLPAIMVPDLFAQVDIEDLSTALQRPPNASGRNFIDATIEVALPGDYLRKVDFMSGANGLEVRLPYLGHQLLEYGQRMPHALRYRRGANKIVLREIARRLLPSQVVSRPKQGFGIPLDSWLGSAGRHEISEMLQRPDSRIAKVVRREWIAGLCQPFSAGTRDASVWSRFMLYQQVYLLWSLERWLLKWDPAF